MFAAQLTCVFSDHAGKLGRRFDVIHHKDGDVFVASAIAFGKDVTTADWPDPWIKVSEGHSEEGVLGALEGLWNMIMIFKPSVLVSNTRHDHFAVDGLLTVFPAGCLGEQEALDCKARPILVVVVKAGISRRPV